jgi:hypothetical protein
MALPLYLTAFDHHFPYYFNQNHIFYSVFYFDFDWTATHDPMTMIRLQSIWMTFKDDEIFFS